MCLLVGTCICLFKDYSTGNILVTNDSGVVGAKCNILGNKFYLSITLYYWS